LFALESTYHIVQECLHILSNSFTSIQRIKRIIFLTRVSFSQIDDLENSHLFSSTPPTEWAVDI
jgi:hypothetical protein